MLLTRDQILKVEGRRHKDIEVPELGGTIRVMSVSAGAGLELKLIGDADNDRRGIAVTMFADAIVDDQNNPVLDQESAKILVQKISIETMNLLIREILALSRSPEKKVENGAAAAEAPIANPSEGSPSASSPSA